MEYGYRFIKDLTSDVMWEASGKDLTEVFTNSAKAMFDIICDRKNIENEKCVEITVKADDTSELMINWLSELIALVDIEEMFFCDFEIVSINNNGLTAKCYGEDMSPEKGETVVKAVTYHNYIFKKTNDGYLTQVVVDI